MGPDGGACALTEDVKWGSCTAAPTGGPTSTPSTSPTDAPSASPTSSPTGRPTDVPTAIPTTTPTETPITAAPTGGPTSTPSTSPTDAPSASPTSSPTESPTPPTPSTWVPFSVDPNSNQEYCLGAEWNCSMSNSNSGSEAPVGGTDEASCLNYCSGYRFCSFDFGTFNGSRCCARGNYCSSSTITGDERAYRIYQYL